MGKIVAGEEDGKRAGSIREVREGEEAIRENRQLRLVSGVYGNVEECWVFGQEFRFNLRFLRPETPSQA